MNIYVSDIIYIGDSGYYTLELVSSIDEADTSTLNEPVSQCAAGANGGLIISTRGNDLSAGYDLGEVSYNTPMEVLVSVVQGDAICTSFKDIFLEVVSSCEMPSPNSEVSQYGYDSGSSDGISYDVEKKLGAIGASASFSVSWSVE